MHDQLAEHLFGHMLVAAVAISGLSWASTVLGTIAAS